MNGCCPADPTDGDTDCDVDAMAVVGVAKKVMAVYPPVVNHPDLLAHLAGEVRALMARLSNPRLRKALEECLECEAFAWDGAGFCSAAVDTRSLAYALDKVADGGGSSNSMVPVRQPCNEPGKARWMVWRLVFEIDEEYTPIKVIGRGAYGVVCSARHRAFVDPVAIKKVPSAFDNLIDARRMLREIKLLRCMRHDNIVGLMDIMRPPQQEQFTDVYLVYELMDTDLQHIIRSSQPLSNAHCQYFIYQILRGLKYIHSANVLHRDLKPGNMLINASCHLKICDFGLARTTAEHDFMTEYVVTRWYRAPELLLSCDTYGPPIDVWSVGCVLAELLGRKPLFAGRDYVDALKLIIRQLGHPRDQDLGFISSEKARQYIRMLPAYEKVPFNTVFPRADPLAIDLLERMLCFDPRQRITVAAALEHPWLAELHNEGNEPCAPFKFEFEEAVLTEEMMRDLVIEEISSIHRGSAPINLHSPSSWL